ncbi:MAG TPA: hypothetical protein VLJ84_10180 [Usitatibacter sp.]|nr:hypothetical protein [Usitatibacter sp.]HST02016.1 hypothetical protein [Usitatibacter sp.]
MKEVRVFDSATKLDASAEGAVVVCGSHGGMYPAWLAAAAGVRALVLNDAGVGRHSAGISGVAWLAGLGIAACAVDYRSARIGDGADTLASGVVTFANQVAASQGCVPGHTCRQAVECLAENALPSPEPVPEIGESRTRIPNSGHRPAWALDSAALVEAGDARAVVLTGSHGALLGGKKDTLLGIDLFAAFFNDAGGGKDGAGFARLAPLDERGIAAATVSHNTARIGDGRSTYETGVISRINETAKRLELREGMSARDAVARLVGLG